jgi:rod shape-determining protein MreD
VIKVYLTWSIIFILLIVLQITVLDYFVIYGYKPDLPLIALVFLTLTYGQITGIIAAFLLGLFFDLLIGGVIGSTSLSSVIAIFICGYFYNENRIDIILGNYQFVLIVLLTSFIDNIVHSLIVFSIDIPTLLRIVFAYGIYPALYTTIVSSVILVRPGKKVFKT